MKKILLLLLILSLTWPVALSAARPKILVVGDSLSAGYGVTTERRWVTLLTMRLEKHCDSFSVVNASISGDTSKGGLSRLPALLTNHRPDIVVIELGGNDGLRGIAIKTMRHNLQQMVRLAKQTNASVLLLGVRLPANYGEDFVNAFHQVYYDVAEAESVPLVPFFLQDVALDEQLMQADGVHPNDQAQPVLLDNVWPELRSIIIDRGLVVGCN
ncbi:MAG: arylesterase [Candidatus Thiodiazotropha endolucinida]